jgi:hypothetical protein
MSNLNLQELSRLGGLANPETPRRYCVATCLAIPFIFGLLLRLRFEIEFGLVVVYP